MRSSTPNFSRLEDARLKRKRVKTPIIKTIDTIIKSHFDLTRSRSTTVTPKSDNKFEDLSNEGKETKRLLKCVLITRKTATNRLPLSSRASSSNRKGARNSLVENKSETANSSPKNPSDFVKKNENLAHQISKLSQKIILPTEAANIVKTIIHKNTLNVLDNKNVW